jgi:hypothetical protein
MESGITTPKFEHGKRWQSRPMLSNRRGLIFIYNSIFYSAAIQCMRVQNDDARTELVIDIVVKSNDPKDEFRQQKRRKRCGTPEFQTNYHIPDVETHRYSS